MEKCGDPDFACTFTRYPVPKDLYNFQVSLQEIDNMRVDGKFVDSEGNKPPGQGVRPPVTPGVLFFNDVDDGLSRCCCTSFDDVMASSTG